MMKRILIALLLMALVVPAWAATKVVAVKSLSISVDHGINLTFDVPAASVFIANPDIADVQVMSPTSVMIFGKRTGETSFMATDSGGRLIEQRTVSVIQDLTNLRQDLDLAIPGNKIRAASVPNGLVLTGEAKDAATIADAYRIAQRYVNGGDIINRVQVSGSNQIQIRVRFAEVQRTINDSLGVDWANLASYGGFVFGLATGNTVNSTLQGASGGTTIGGGLFPRPNNATLSQANNVLGISRTGGRLDLNAMIDALAQDGLVTILAEPTLTAMSGETANFLAGGEFPIPVPQGGTSNSITIDFKNYGISLAFTPTVISQNRISLHVKPEVSQLTTAGSITLNSIAVPALTTRRAETTVEVASGQSFAIAGLIDNSQSETVTKYPLLGDLPILGALFRSSQFQNGQTELVIIITPYLVKPNGDQQLALPTDGFSMPSQSERLFDLRYSSADPNARPLSGRPVGVRDEPSTQPAAVAPVQQVPVSNVPPPSDNPAPSPSAVPAEEPAPGPASREETPTEPMALVPNGSRIKVGTEHVTPTYLSPEETAPSGLGGFILE